MPQFSCLALITEKITKISKKASLIESTAFASYRIFLIEITTICFGKVQYIPVWIAREYKSWLLNNIVRLMSIQEMGYTNLGTYHWKTYGGRGGRSTKKIFAQGKITWKKFMHAN